MDIKGLIIKDGKDIKIYTSLSFLTLEYFKKYIEGKSYIKIKENNESFWVLKSENRYIIDIFDGVDDLVEDLQKEAIYDSLTKCYNKKETLHLLDRFLKEYLRYDNPLSLMMIDIDFFKRVNDTYGHLAGDFVLKEMTKIIKSTIRKSDICGRFGGEEFLIILPNTKLSGAMKLAERIRENIQKSVFIFENKKIYITISIGITTASKKDNLVSLIERADKALYEAKRKGRNRVEYR